VLVLIEADVIEDEELGFGAEERGVGHARVIEVQLGLLRDPSRVALVALFGDRVLHVAVEDECGDLGEGIEEGSGGVGDQQHVALVDGGPAADTGAVHTEAFFEAALFELADRIGDVVLQARDVGEAEIDLLHVVVLGEFEYFLRRHLSSS
jgi:hypothetical protein